MILDAASLRLAALVQSSDDAISSEDLRGVIETWNASAERIFGYTQTEIIGKPHRLLVPPDDIDEEQEMVERIRRGDATRHVATVRIAKDGSRIQVSETVSPILTPDGEIVGVSRIARDVGRQQLLERQALRLAAIVNSSEDAIVSKTLEGIIQTWNHGAERMFGYTAEEAIGRSIRLIVPQDRMAEEDDVLRRVREGLGVEHFETVRRRKDGRLVDISLSVSPIKDAEGFIIGASKVARDITAQRQLMAQLEEASRVKDEFLATLSHELRTPLNAVIGYTRMLRGGQMSDDRRERTIEIIERNAKLLSQLVADVLDLSGIVTGRIRISPSLCNLADVVKAAAEVVKPTADAKQLHLSVATPDEPVRVSCDSERMQQVFWNLLINAIKFTKPGGSVDVTVSREGAVAKVVVRDTGIGIRPDFVPYLFQRFRQAESVSGRELGGLGLGLALVRHFVELHGGEVAAFSAGEGQGTAFTVTLPLAR